MGNIITLQDGLYSYELPPEPSDEKDIINFDKKKRDQKWTIPPMLDFKRCSLSQKQEFIERERDRWLNGVWVLINGELVYLTGMHYDHLTYMTFEFGKAKYLDHQRLDFYFRDLTRKSNTCLGRMWQKPRRYGMTAEELTESLYTSMEGENIGVALMSNESNKCKNTLLKPIIDACVKRPKFMRPRFYSSNGKKPRSKLEYYNPKVDERGEYDASDDYLGGHIFAYPTTPAAIDGEKKKYIVMDEVWKWMVASPAETLGINKKCLRSSDWLGKISMLSTMGDSDDYANSVREGIQIINESNPRNLDDNGMTISGLWEYFVPAIYSFDIPPFYDEYGKLDAGRAEEYILNTRKNLQKGTKAYVFELRRMPLRKEEMMMSSNLQAIHDKVRINERLHQLNQLPRSRKPYTIGRFESDIYGKVTFHPDPENGKWKVAIHPYYDLAKNIDTRNRFKQSDGQYHPPENPEFGIGYDPIRYMDTTSKSLSKAAIMVGKKFDYFGSGVVNRIAALYLDRPEDPEEAHDEFFKALRYYGGKGLYERQGDSVLRKGKEIGMTPMMMKNPKDGQYGLWTDKNKVVTKNGVDLIQARIKEPKDGQEDLLMTIPFEEALYDAEGFDPLHTTVFDVYMSWIEMEHCLLWIPETNITDQDLTGKIIDKAMFPSRAGQSVFN